MDRIVGDSKNSNTFLSTYIYPKLKFGVSSVISTSVDYIVFFVLLSSPLAVAVNQIIAQSCGMLTNFFLQRFFIFEQNRTFALSFVWSISFSLIAILLASTSVHFLYMIPFFQEYPLVMKAGVTIVFFFFNFYTKQYAFEKKVQW